MPIELTADDLYLFRQGRHFRMYEKFGAHLDRAGATFAVWAPAARSVAVVGDFNDWSKTADPLAKRDDSGVWFGHVSGAAAGDMYKFHVVSSHAGHEGDKADPLAFASEVPPATASRLCSLDYEWSDGDWMRQRAGGRFLEEPVSIYEVHLGSWKRVPEEGNRPLTYLEMATELADYVTAMGFTHVELLPVMEHPFYGSWGYQTTGYFGPTSRYGSPEDLMYLIDQLHQRGIGVILDWVPSHFPDDGHALAFFDGTHLYEHADPRRGHHPDWDSLIFNYEVPEVRSFLISSACFWLDRYHADGLRVDAVASMLYLDFSRKAGEWIPNEKGGRENLAAIEFLRQLNVEVYGRFPGAQTIAEESTAWPLVSRPTHEGGLGFGLKWDMGWMHDTLEYMRLDPLFRRASQEKLTFRAMYAFSENFVLPLSHDEVVHEKGSLLSRMPGDSPQKLANLRLLLAWMYCQPGKKLLFMGGELGQWHEWSHERSLDWHLQAEEGHLGVQHWVRDLNRLYRAEQALHQTDCDPGGFEWIDCEDRDQSVLSFQRRDREEKAILAAVFNFTPVERAGYLLGVPEGGFWQIALSSDAPGYGGEGREPRSRVKAQPVEAHGLPHSVTLTLPPLSALILRRTGR